MVIELPKVTLKGKTYYRDDRLRQLRNVDNPHDYLNFTEYASQMDDYIHDQRLVEAREIADDWCDLDFRDFIRKHNGKYGLNLTGGASADEMFTKAMTVINELDPFPE